MAIAVEFQQCRAKAEVADSVAGAKGKCRTCGAIVHVPGTRRKLCVGCGIDVAVAKRWKDEAGQYYFENCWQLSHIAATTAPPTAQGSMMPADDDVGALVDTVEDVDVLTANDLVEAGSHQADDDVAAASASDPLNLIALAVHGGRPPRTNIQRAQPSAQTLLQCDRCGTPYPPAYFTRMGCQNLCVTCHIAERKKLEQKKANRAEAGKNLARRTGRAVRQAILILFAAVAVVVVISAYNQFGPSVTAWVMDGSDLPADSDATGLNATEIQQKALRVRDEGDALVRQGRWKSANYKYLAFFTLAQKMPGGDDPEAELTRQAMQLGDLVKDRIAKGYGSEADPEHAALVLAGEDADTLTQLHDAIVAARGEGDSDARQGKWMDAETFYDRARQKAIDLSEKPAYLLKGFSDLPALQKQCEDLETFAHIQKADAPGTPDPEAAATTELNELNSFASSERRWRNLRGDPIIQAYVEQHPDMEDQFHRLDDVDRRLIQAKLEQQLLTGNVDLETAQHITHRVDER